MRRLYSICLGGEGDIPYDWRFLEFNKARFHIHTHWQRGLP
jgi:hypothetical protein